MINPLQMALGLEGLALLRGWLTADEAVVASISAEIRSLAGGSPKVSFAAPEHSVESGYAAWAPTYDQPGNPFVDIEQSAVWGLLDQLPIGRVVDAACGTGRHAIHLHSLGHRVVAVDSTPLMLAKLRGRSPEIEVLEGDLRDLPFEACSLDAVVCSLALTHLVDLERPIMELARVIRPGGRVIISDIHPFAVVLGTQAASTAADGTRGFVRNYPHPVSAYFAAFRSAGPEVHEILEPCLAAQHARMLLGMTLQAFPHLEQSLGAAIDGLPAALIWSLTRT